MSPPLTRTTSTPVKPFFGTEESGSSSQQEIEPLQESYSSDDDEEVIHGTNVGYEIYGRESCRFCEAARRVLASKGLSYTWCTMQRFDQKSGKLEPPTLDGITVVARSTVERRLERCAPGSPPIETVPQIFKDGEYVGGFSELCVTLDVPKTVMDVALLNIGGKSNSEGWAHTWNAAPSLRRGPSVRALFDLPSDDTDSEQSEGKS